MVTELKVLIVEDSESKGNSIQAVLVRELPSITIHRALSVRSAIDSIIEFKPDIIIADMSLPTYDIEVRERGGTPRPFGGIEVFETLERYGIMLPVVVVTAYEAISDGSQTMSLSEMSKRLKSEFPECYIGTVYFDSAFSKWERELVEYFHQILESYNDT